VEQIENMPELRKTITLRFSRDSGATPMSDTKSGPLSLELITKTMNELAREVGMMDPDDPNWEPYLNKLFELDQLKRSLKEKIDPIGARMDELAHEMTTLKAGDPRRVQIKEIKRLKSLDKNPS